VKSEKRQKQEDLSSDSELLFKVFAQILVLVHGMSKFT
jgi:hypothetical protein